MTWGIKDKGPDKKGPLRNFAKERIKRATKMEKDRLELQIQQLEYARRKKEGIKRILSYGNQKFKRLNIEDIGDNSKPIFKHFST